MSFGTNTTQSNLTGLAIAEETTYKNLPTTPIWTPLEPNEYSDFGGDVTMVARNPIKSDRQLRKGVVTDLEASAAFGMDFTQKTPYSLLPGFMFANWRQQNRGVATAASATAFTTSAITFPTNALVFADGFDNSENNGIFKRTGGTTTSHTVGGLTAESGVSGTLTLAGVEFGSGVLRITTSGTEATLTAAGFDFSDYVIPGQWVFVGGDDTSDKFTGTANGWYRASKVGTTTMVCDRLPDGLVANNGSGKTIRMFFGDVLKNESDPSNIVCRSYTVERQLGANALQYVVGCAANQLELAIPTSDKITAALTYTGADSLGETTKRAGTRLPLPVEDAYNSVSNVTRLRMLNDETGGALYTFVSEASLNIDNGITGVKAVGTLGSFDMSLGDFKVSGSVSAYFTTIEAVQVVRDNTSVSLDYSMVTNNQGWLIDVPYLTMSDGRPAVEKDKPVTIPLNISGAAHPDFNHTLLINYFAYLPDLAE